jgi:hypothetical protein
LFLLSHTKTLLQSLLASVSVPKRHAVSVPVQFMHAHFSQSSAAVCKQAI